MEEEEGQKVCIERRRREGGRERGKGKKGKYGSIKGKGSSQREVSKCVSVEGKGRGGR